MMESKTVRVRANQKFFTDVEVADLFGAALDEVRELARLKRLGILARAAEAAEAATVSAGQLLFTLSDLMVLTVLWRHVQQH
ncbi:MAG TPA: hypothetical protein VKG84_09825 [Candidatus Acidoferrales bacterium]|nr:hypothetical protein [Candidatus Acidoferrales bacterium]